MKTIIALLLFFILFSLCWPFAILFLILLPFIWLILLPFKVLGYTFTFLFGVIVGIFLLPFKMLGL